MIFYKFEHGFGRASRPTFPPFYPSPATSLLRPWSCSQTASYPLRSRANAISAGRGPSRAWKKSTRTGTRRRASQKHRAPTSKVPRYVAPYFHRRIDEGCGAFRCQPLVQRAPRRSSVPGVSRRSLSSNSLRAFATSRTPSLEGRAFTELLPRGSIAVRWTRTPSIERSAGPRPRRR